MSYFLTLPTDDKYERKLQHTKQVLAERGKKIFNPVRAKEAYDASEIQHQITDKKNRERAETMRNLTFDQAARRLDTVHYAIMQKEEDFKKATNTQLEQYRKLFQRKEDSASFELNDPHWLQKQRPIGANGDFSSYGPSSVVTFDGEKLRTPKDLKNSILKQQADLAKQLAEQKILKDHERNVNNIHSAEFVAQQAKLDAIDRAMEDLQKATTLATRRYNEALIAACNNHIKRSSNVLQNEGHYNQQETATQEDHKRRFSELEQRDAAAHVSNVVNGALFNEISVHPRDWRGMSSAQLHSVFAERDKQVQERNNDKQQAKQEDYVWDNYFRTVENRVRQEILALEKERETVRKDMDALNRKIAGERKDREELEEIGKNGAQPTKEWFDKFESDPR